MTFFLTNKQSKTLTTGTPRARTPKSPTQKKVAAAFGNGVDEDTIQKNIIMWAGWVKYSDRKLVEFIHHSPNGGLRSGREGAKFRDMGTKAGYPDLILDIARKGYHGLRIELKRSKGGKVSAEQKQRLQLLNNEGYLAVVCKGYDEALDAIKDYMGIKKNDSNQWECDLV